MTIEIDYDDYPHAKGHEARVVEDEDGVLRYRANKIIRFLVDSNKVNLNELMCMYLSDMVSLEDMMEFYRLIGYSLNGFEEIWHEKDPATRTYECQNCDNVVEKGTALCEECLVRAGAI